MYYIVAWHSFFYYILSDDETFPEYKAGSKDSAMLARCRQRFWLSPASDLGGMMPGLLDAMDAAYRKNITNVKGVSLFNPADKEWRRMWKKYANSVLKVFNELENNTTWLKVPPRASARLAYFLFEMRETHTMSVFPTASFIRDFDNALQASKLSFADVRVRVLAGDSF